MQSRSDGLYYTEGMEEGFQMMTFNSYFSVKKMSTTVTMKHFELPLGKVTFLGQVVVAQLAERSLTTPDVRSSNPVIGRTLY